MQMLYAPKNETVCKNIRGPVEQSDLLERGGARWSEAKTVPHRFDAARSF
jgi:hypothetical protein